MTHSRITPPHTHTWRIPLLFLTQPHRMMAWRLRLRRLAASWSFKYPSVCWGFERHQPQTGPISTGYDTISTSRVLIERMHNHIDSVDSPQNENTEYENSKVMTLEVPPPSSSKDQPQDTSKKPPRRSKEGAGKGLRRHISHMLSSLFCCLVNPKTGDATPR